MMQLDTAARTHVGRRTNNEDALCEEHGAGLFAVADGMGGYEGGEVASTLAIDALRTFVAGARRGRPVEWPVGYDPEKSPGENLLRTGVALAHRAICEKKSGALRSMGSTVAALCVDPRGAIAMAHVGDSRVYRLRDRALERLTRDHSLIEDLRERGLLEQFGGVDGRYANVITRALGMSEEPRADTRQVRAAAGDVYLLCSDGLSGPVGDDEIARILAQNLSAERTAEQLVDAALAHDGSDNITVLVLRVLAA